MMNSGGAQIMAASQLQKSGVLVKGKGQKGIKGSLAQLLMNLGSLSVKNPQTLPFGRVMSQLQGKFAGLGQPQSHQSVLKGLKAVFARGTSSPGPDDVLALAPGEGVDEAAQLLLGSDGNQPKSGHLRSAVPVPSSPQGAAGNPTGSSINASGLPGHIVQAGDAQPGTPGLNPAPDIQVPPQGAVDIQQLSGQPAGNIAPAVNAQPVVPGLNPAPDIQAPPQGTVDIQQLSGQPAGNLPSGQTPIPVPAQARPSANVPGPASPHPDTVPDKNPPVQQAAVPAAITKGGEAIAPVVMPQINPATDPSLAVPSGIPGDQPSGNVDLRVNGAIDGLITRLPATSALKPGIVGGEDGEKPSILSQLAQRGRQPQQAGRVGNHVQPAPGNGPSPAANPRAIAAAIPQRGDPSVTLLTPAEIALQEVVEASPASAKVAASAALALTGNPEGNKRLNIRSRVTGKSDLVDDIVFKSGVDPGARAKAGRVSGIQAGQRHDSPANPHAQPQGSNPAGAQHEPVNSLTNPDLARPNALEEGASALKITKPADIGMQGQTDPLSREVQVSTLQSQPTSNGTVANGPGSLASLARLTVYHYNRYVNSAQRQNVFQVDGGSMGNVKITFSDTSAGTLMQIVVDTPELQQQLQRALPQLQQEWNLQGLNLGRVNVEVGGSGEDTAFNGEESQPGNPTKQSTEALEEAALESNMERVRDYGYNTVEFVA